MTATKDSVDPNLEEIRRLRSELKARIAETAWIKAHYGRHLQEAFAALETLRASSMGPSQPAAAKPTTGQPALIDSDQASRLDLENQRLQLAERRYLDRIEELKDALSAKRLAKSEAQ